MAEVNQLIADKVVEQKLDYIVKALSALQFRIYKNEDNIKDYLSEVEQMKKQYDEIVAMDIDEAWVKCKQLDQLISDCNK